MDGHVDVQMVSQADVQTDGWTWLDRWTEMDREMDGQIDGLR